MKDKRICNDNMYPVYPSVGVPNMVNPAFTGPMMPQPLPYYNYNQTNMNTSDINSIERRLNNLENRISNLEKKVNNMNNTPSYSSSNAGNNNTYTDSNYYMV